MLKSGTFDNKYSIYYKVVVTAAHCLRYKTGYQYRANEWKVSAGHITAFGYDDPRFKYDSNMRKVKKVIVHK